MSCAQEEAGRMEMNSPAGKRTLALIRGGDYAHPGEEEAIDLLMRKFACDGARTILDVGCGRGGTAQYLQSHGWGRATGLDIDSASIDYAKASYPDVEFVAGDACQASSLLQRRHFDLFCLLTSFYAFPDQSVALRELRKLSTPGSSLVIMDYWDTAGHDGAPPFRHDSPHPWTPLKPGKAECLFEAADWRIESFEDISGKFYGWYHALTHKIEAVQERISAQEGPERYAFVLNFYSSMRDAIAEGRLGGALLVASPR